jgi:hypothetical protein
VQQQQQQQQQLLWAAQRMWTERDDDVDVIMQAKYQALLMQGDQLSRKHR